MTVRALVLTHASHEDLAGFRAPVEAAGYAIETCPAPDQPSNWLSPDLLIAMGGPMGVYERGAHPWIEGRVAGLAARIAAGRPTLGICLGAQLIAAALGAEVRVGPTKEVGYAPVRLLPAAAATPLRHLEGHPVLHWHGDTFDLPDGTERLVETDSYANQAFRRGDALLAVQFHPEMGGADGLEPWLRDAGDYLEAAGTTSDRLRAQHRRYGAAAVAAGERMVAEWLARLP